MRDLKILSILGALTGSAPYHSSMTFMTKPVYTDLTFSSSPSSWGGSSKGLTLKPVSFGSRKVSFAGSSSSAWARNLQASSPFTST